MTELYSVFSPFERLLESASRRMKSVAAHPLYGETGKTGKLPEEIGKTTRIGDLYENSLLMKALEMQGRKEQTVNQSLAMSLHDETLFINNFEPFTIESAPYLNGIQAVQSERISPSLREKTKPIDKARTIEIIQDLFRFATKHIAREVFTPFFKNGVQVEATLLVEKILKYFETELAKVEQDGAIEGVTIYDTPLPGRVVETVTRGYCLPFFLAVNDEKNDFDSGKCDKHANTSFSLGESIQILAESGEFVLILGEGGNYGWVDKNHTGRDTAEALSSLENKQRVYYVGPIPYFYEQDGEKRMIRPFDPIYLENERYFTQVNDNEGGWVLEEIPGIDHTYVLPKLDFTQPDDLQMGLGTLFDNRMPYTLPADDCSRTVQAWMKLGGYTLSRDSQSQMTDLQEIFPESQVTVTEASELNTLAKGLYTVNLLMPDENDDYVSQHIFIVHVDKLKKITAFSQAFRVVGDEGIETPIGPHVCHNAALETQLSKKRKLVWTQIAA